MVFLDRIETAAVNLWRKQPEECSQSPPAPPAPYNPHPPKQNSHSHRAQQYKSRESATPNSHPHSPKANSQTPVGKPSPDIPALDNSAQTAAPQHSPHPTTKKTAACADRA